MDDLQELLESLSVDKESIEKLRNFLLRQDLGAEKNHLENLLSALVDEYNSNFKKSLQDVCMDLHDLGTEVLRQKWEDQEEAFNKRQKEIIENDKLKR